MASPAQVDDVSLREVERLIIQEASDLVGQFESLTEAQILEVRKTAEEKERQRLNEIRTRPDLTPYILASLDRHIEMGDSTAVTLILMALSMRSDVAVAQFEKIKANIQAILGEATPTADDMELAYLGGGVDVLAMQPSEENETLIIRIMELRNDFRGIDLRRWAARALTRVGTSRCLPALEKARNWLAELSHNNTDWAFVVPEMEAAVSSVKARVSASNSAIKTGTESIQPGRDSRPSAQAIERSPSTALRSDGAWKIAVRRFVCGAIIAAAIGAAWLMLRRPK